MDEPPIGSETAEWRTGSQFGPYLLKGLLGSGGFGEVYEAVDTTKNRIVALKLLPPSYTANPNFRQRLFREASTAGRLNEPHVVPIHDYGEIDGQLYIDMRLIPGTDLRIALEATGPLRNRARRVHHDPDRVSTRRRPRRTHRAPRCQARQHPFSPR